MIVRKVVSLGELGIESKPKQERKHRPRGPVHCCFCGKRLRGGAGAWREPDPSNPGAYRSRCFKPCSEANLVTPFIVEDVPTSENEPS